MEDRLIPHINIISNTYTLDLFNRFTSLINLALSTVACISIETAQDSIVLLACTGNLHKQSFIIKSLFDFI